MSKNQETKIVPPVSIKAEKVSRSIYVQWFMLLIIVYFILILLISFLPLTGYMKVLSLLLGAFLLFDVHHSLKYYVKNRE